MPGMPASRTRIRVLSLLGLCAAAVAALRAIPVRVELRPPVPPPASGAFLLARDGTRLFHEIDAPADPRAIVWIVQGIEVESGPSFPALRAALRRAGVGVATMHPRGTGFSDGPRGDVDDFRKILEDERTFARALRARFPRTPIALLGHGAGAAFAVETAAALADEVRFDGVILVNPAVGRREGGVGPGARDLATYAAYLLFRPATPIVDMGGDPSRLRDPGDRRDAERAKADPLRVPRFSMRLLLGLRSVMNRSVENARGLRMPLLVICGKGDEIVDPSSGDDLARAWGGARTEVRRVWGGHGTAVVEGNADAIVAFVTRACARPSG